MATHWIDLTEDQLRILYISIPTHTKEWEHMRPVVAKLERHLEVAKLKKQA